MTVNSKEEKTRNTFVPIMSKIRPLVTKDLVFLHSVWIVSTFNTRRESCSVVQPESVSSVFSFMHRPCTLVCNALHKASSHSLAITWGCGVALLYRVRCSCNRRRPAVYGRPAFESGSEPPSTERKRWGNLEQASANVINVWMNVFLYVLLKKSGVKPPNH